MRPTEVPELPAARPPLPLFAAADLQDNLLTAAHDLDRLQGLLSHACDELLQGFHAATAQLRQLADADGTPLPAIALLTDATHHLGGAVTALQFQDMASQLIAHTQQRLRNCADRIASEAMGDDEDGQAVVEAPPVRPNPVTQDEMDAGSVELF
jgi:hypothetical protein